MDDMGWRTLKSIVGFLHMDWVDLSWSVFPWMGSPI